MIASYKEELQKAHEDIASKVAIITEYKQVKNIATIFVLEILLIFLNVHLFCLIDSSKNVHGASRTEKCR